MADNSMMGNVTQVEQYGKSLGQVQQQMREIFKKLQQQTKSIGSVCGKTTSSRILNKSSTRPS